MKRILVCGLCPLPFENTRQSFGPGIRTWQLARGLALAGFDVHLVAMKIPGAFAGTDALSEETRDDVRIERLDDSEFFTAAEIRRRIDELRPDAVVGATVYGSFVLADAGPQAPFWADQFGHFMAEAQAKARLESANWPLGRFWGYLEPVLRTADKISVVSERQRFAAIGELGLVGRLTAETCGYELTAVVPCAMVPASDVPLRPLLRGREVPDEAFVVLWSGGYNVWSDVDTLWRGLELAMDRDSRVQFVSTGGQIDRHDERTYQRFERLVAGSRHAERCHLQGWVEAELVPSYQAEADLGVLAELPIYEGLLGSKNRIIQWLGSGLPVAYNRHGDLGELLAAKGLGLVFEIGDAAGLGERILWAASHRDDLRRLAADARDYAQQELSFAATTRPLVEWARDPVPAPDAALRPTISSPADFGPPKSPKPNPLAEKLAEAERYADSLAVELRRSRSELGAIYRSRTWRLWMAYVALRRRILRPFLRTERPAGGAQ